LTFLPHRPRLKAERNPQEVGHGLEKR
jgi:hypothetical protein